MNSVGKIEFQINDNVLRDTTKCRKDFSCLSGEKECLCELKYCSYDQSYYINPNTEKFCNYMICYGSTILCSCPVRREIFDRYKI